MIGTYASAILISLAAIVLGRGICVLSGHAGSTWLAPAVGFAALMVVCEVFVSLPGHGWTAVAAVVIVCVASVWVGFRRRDVWPSIGDGAFVALCLLVITAIPFLASGRGGILGISFLNDTHWHLILAQGLLQPSIRHLDTYGPGYPLGPHAVAATFAQMLGSSVDKTLTGVLIATPVLTGLTALGFVPDLSRPRRWLVAILAGIPYLAAAWYVQSAFKEPIMSLLLLGMVLALQMGRRRLERPVAVLVPIAVLTAGVLYDYSYPGLVWPVAILACWLGLELLLGGWRRLDAIGHILRGALPAFGIAAIVLVVLIAPDLHRMYTFWQSSGGASVGTVGGVTTTSLANLKGPLSTLEGFNIWLYGDFRFSPTNQLDAGALAGFAIVLVLFAILRALERRELAWLGGVIGLGLIYAYAKHSQSPYVAAKALAIPGPLLAVGVGAALLRQVDRAAWRSYLTWAAVAGSIAFFALAFESDYFALADAQVGPDNHTQELRSLRRYLHNRPTLVLFYDDYFKWELLGVTASSPLLPSLVPAWVSPAKPWTYGQPLDFDSITPAVLNQFDYVITTRTTAQSQPPPNFHLVATSRSYEVWKRIGPTPPFLVLPESGHPGAILDCKTAAGRQISHERGFAMVRAAPIYSSVPSLAPGQSTRITLHLPAGRWALSLPFVSSQSITVQGAGLNVQLPPNLDRPGPIWPVGQITSSGAPVSLTVKMADPGLIPAGTPSTQFFAPQPLVAVRAAPDRRLPLGSACGSYVDWYQVS